MASRKGLLSSVTQSIAARPLSAMYCRRGAHDGHSAEVGNVSEADIQELKFADQRTYERNFRRAIG